MITHDKYMYQKNNSSNLFVADRIKSIVACRTRFLSDCIEDDLPNKDVRAKTESSLIQQITVNFFNFAQENIHTYV